MWSNKKLEAPPAVPKPREPVTYAPAPASALASAAPVSAPAAIPSPAEEIAMNANEPMRPLTAAAQGTARLGPSLHVKGEISGNEDLHVDGSVEGLITLEDRKLTVGSSAKLTADVVAREVVVYGNVKGNLRARDRIEIKKDGSVIGDLTTARIMIEDGAYFKGSIEIDRGDSADSDSAHRPFARAAGKSD